MRRPLLLCLALNVGCTYSVLVGESPGVAGGAGTPQTDSGAASACPAAYWTNGILCEPRFSLLCANTQLIIVEDSSASENAAAHDLAQALAMACPTPPSVRATTQADTAVLEAGSGRPVSGPGAVLLLVGGPERQAGLAYLQQHAASAIGKVDGAGYYLTSPEGRAAGGLNPVGNDRDLIAIQTLREPVSQSVVLSIFGQREAGSVAGVLAFEVDLGALTASRTWWFTLNWQDSNGDLTPDAADQLLIGTRSGT